MNGDNSQLCRQQAIRLLARREYAAQELAQRLARSHDAALVAQVIETLQQQDLQSDARYVAARIRSRVQQGYGPLKIRHELQQVGIKETLLMAELDALEVDWDAQMTALMARRGVDLQHSSLQERAKQSRFLARRGFSGEQIRTLWPSW